MQSIITDIANTKITITGIAIIELKLVICRYGFNIKSIKCSIK